MLPEILIEPLQKHLPEVKKQHEADLKAGFGTVFMPYALDRKYPGKNKEWGWQYVFPASKLSIDPRSGIEQRHHLDETAVQKEVHDAIRKAGIHKHAGCHTFRHSFATHLPREIIFRRKLNECLLLCLCVTIRKGQKFLCWVY
ncbi:MAG: tyrosine-type recombinase/integrase [candidate division KSB1 bacterium]|nr:tyrosine-type recombinase/integrase [candidate division KSB1 bacterium]